MRDVVNKCLTKGAGQYHYKLTMVLVKLSVLANWDKRLSQTIALFSIINFSKKGAVSPKKILFVLSFSCVVARQV